MVPYFSSGNLAWSENYLANYIPKRFKAQNRRMPIWLQLHSGSVNGFQIAKVFQVINILNVFQIMLSCLVWQMLACGMFMKCV